MKKFVFKLILLFLPFVIAFSPLLYAVLYSGECSDYDAVIKKQHKDPSALVGRGFDEQTEYYKKQNANYYKADVIALGTSRVMQFKSEYFSSSFYNCGGAVNNNFDEYVNFLENLNYTPELIILGLDSWLFNTNYYDMPDYPDYVEITKEKTDFVSVFSAAALALRDGKWKLRNVKNYPLNIGFNGKIKDEGFMFDGSYYYGSVYRSGGPDPANPFPDVFERIENGTLRFQYGDTVSAETVEKLSCLLEYCYDREIYVIGFIPPFAPAVYDKMINSGNYEYLSKVYDACVSLFKSFDFELYDYTSPSVLNVDDSFFVDGFHGSEIVYALIIKNMAAQNSRVKEHLDGSALNQWIENRSSNLAFE